MAGSKTRRLIKRNKKCSIS